MATYKVVTDVKQPLDEPAFYSNDEIFPDVTSKKGKLRQPYNVDDDDDFNVRNVRGAVSLAKQKMPKQKLTKRRSTKRKSTKKIHKGGSRKRKTSKRVGKRKPSKRRSKKKAQSKK